MPMYEYRCDTCGACYEQLRRMSDAERDLKCPRCDSECVELLVSAFATRGCVAGSGRFT